MLQSSVSHVILRMALPTMMSFLINAIYSLTDTYFVSGLGTNITAAVGINAALDQLILMLGSFLAVGSASYIACLLGRGDIVIVNRVFSTAFLTAMALGTLLMAVGLVFTLPMVRFLGASPTCEQYAVEYTRNMLLGAPFMPACFVMNHCLRSEGHATFSMLGMCISSIVNCVLDPLLIFKLNMGIGGAALATTISKWLLFAILVSRFIGKKSITKLSARFFTLRRDVIFNIVSVGSSSFFQFGLDTLAAIVLNNITGTISDAALAGTSVCTRIMTFPVGMIHGFCNGAQPVVGFNWGAKQKVRVERAYQFSARSAVAAAFVMMSVLILCSTPLVEHFAKADKEMLRFGRACVIAQGVALPAYAWVSVVNMMCIGLGRAKYALVLATAKRGICFVPTLFLLYWVFGAYGVAVSPAVADLLLCGFAIPIVIKLRAMIRYDVI